MKIRTPTDQYKFKLMTPKIYQVLDDHSSDYEFYQLHDMIRYRVGRVRKLWLKMVNYVAYIIEHKLKLSIKISVIMPDSVFKIVWDITVLAMIILNIFYIPMKLAFDLEENTSMLDLLLDTLPSWVSFKFIKVNRSSSSKFF